MEETVINNPLKEGELKLKLRLQDAEAQLLEVKIKNDELLRDNTQLKRENAQLKRMPLVYRRCCGHSREWRDLFTAAG